MAFYGLSDISVSGNGVMTGETCEHGDSNVFSNLFSVALCSRQGIRESLPGHLSGDLMNWSRLSIHLIHRSVNNYKTFTKR